MLKLIPLSAALVTLLLAGAAPLSGQDSGPRLGHRALLWFYIVDHARITGIAPDVVICDTPLPDSTLTRMESAFIANSQVSSLRASKTCGADDFPRGTLRIESMTLGDGPRNGEVRAVMAIADTREWDISERYINEDLTMMELAFSLADRGSLSAPRDSRRGTSSADRIDALEGYLRMRRAVIAAEPWMVICDSQMRTADVADFVVDRLPVQGVRALTSDTGCQIPAAAQVDRNGMTVLIDSMRVSTRSEVNLHARAAGGGGRSWRERFEVDSQQRATLRLDYFLLRTIDAPVVHD